MSFSIVLNLVVDECRRGAVVWVRARVPSSAAVDGIASMKAGALLNFGIVGIAIVYFEEVIASTRSGDRCEDEDCCPGSREQARGCGG
jgi:hypothetical protein